MNGYILLGSPGSGKGTLGQFLKSIGIEHIASGDILRREVREGTSLGMQTEQWIHEGKQIPDELITEIVLKRLQECIEQHKRFVLDGYPQTPPQLASLRSFLSEHPDCPVTTICVEIKPETALKRMAGRISCIQCEAIYHKSMRPPVQEGICDNCNIPLVARESDLPGKAIVRLQQFEQTTKKVMECVRHYPHVFSIDGNLSPDSVREQLNKILEHE